MNDSGGAPPLATGGFGVFAQLTRALRHAAGRDALFFSIVNETRRLVPYRQAALLLDGGDGRLRVEAMSGVPVVNRQAPLVRWLESAAAAIARDPAAGDRPLPIASDDPDRPYAAAIAEGRGNHGTGNVLWCPLVSPGGQLMGALWLERAEAWREPEILLLAELTDAQAHALWTLSGWRAGTRGRWRRLAFRAAAAVAIVGFMAVPVHRAALAPVEITPRDPEVVAAAIDGVVRSFQVQPNQRIEAGDPLFRLDDTDRRAQVEVAGKALEIARAELRQASQGALGGRRDAPRLAALEAEVALREVELEHAREQLGRTQARAGRGGVALVPDPQDWIGRPVATGERVMLVADPAEVQARAWLPVRDAMPLRPGAPVRLFLDVDPLTPLDGRLVHANHDAEQVPDGGMAYRVTIALDADAGGPAPRIGLTGTARIEGDRVPLFLYLFHRPIAALRQSIGF